MIGIDVCRKGILNGYYVVKKIINIYFYFVSESHTNFSLPWVVRQNTFLPITMTKS